MKYPINRRMIIGASLSLIAVEAFAGRRERDRGIGGTGVVAAPDEGDRGIGGTGVIGTIREFGSIIVNGMRIAYPASAKVEIDGRIASLKALRLGQVVQTLATFNGASFATDRIVITSEVVGPIENIAQGRLTVLGQTVATDFIDANGLKKGQWIAVSGLRDLNGAIHASYVQHRDDSLAQVAGPVSVSNGVARIGGLPLVNLDRALEGRRVLAQVGRIDGQPAAISVTPDPERAVLGHAQHLLIETYVVRKAGELRMGSGLVATPSSSPSNAAPATAPVRAVVAVTVNSDGSMTASTVRAVADPDTAPAADSQPKKASSDKSETGDHDAKGGSGEKNGDDRSAKQNSTSNSSKSDNSTAPAKDANTSDSSKSDASRNAPASTPSPAPEPPRYPEPSSMDSGGGRRR